MDEQIIKEYDSFETSLNKKIKSKVVILANNYYYLIKENWHNKINGLINCIKNNQLDKSKDDNILLEMKKEEPEFIDDISFILDCLLNKIKIKFISIKLFKLIYDKNILKNHNKVLFSSGNNRIIIEYEGKQENALLLINPLENISRILLISTLNQLELLSDKNHLYKDLIKKEKLDLDKIYIKYYRILTNLKDFSDIYSSQINKENNQSKNGKINKKKRLNKSVDYNQNNSSKNNELKKNYQIRTMPNNNEANINNLDHLELKIKDLQEKIAKKDKIIENLETEKNNYKSKYLKYKEKIKKVESNKLQNLKNIINF
jgi:hypothetical protein